MSATPNSSDPLAEQTESSEDLEAAAAAAEAAQIGGLVEDDGLDPAEHAVSEGGGGEAEGFELAEHELIEHASHGDQQSAHAILHDQGPDEEDTEGADAEGDEEHSSELDEGSSES